MHTWESTFLMEEHRRQGPEARLRNRNDVVTGALCAQDSVRRWSREEAYLLGLQITGGHLDFNLIVEAIGLKWGKT